MWRGDERRARWQRCARAPAESIDLCRLGARRSMRSVSFSIVHVTLGRVPCPAVPGRDRGECGLAGCGPRSRCCCCSRASCSCLCSKIWLRTRFCMAPAASGSAASSRPSTITSTRTSTRVPGMTVDTLPFSTFTFTIICHPLLSPLTVRFNGAATNSRQMASQKGYKVRSKY